ncbi:hypothetical protein PARHAE_02442 [Paracoccus haematequi]|uniref:Uncharacterized protein n=1 Tax=Paracoccus haematequi TaxID=2491866 RepID=A0A447IP63_9RHOB|nr:hypothetical protein [Paracoccus haematequi]VDS09250.1 hypothetical protein PARHAE_02442 [Paracoccus haematequi]
MTGQRDYIVLQDAWIAGRPAKAGEIVSLTEREARYEPVESAAPKISAEPARRAKTRSETDA